MPLNSNVKRLSTRNKTVYALGDHTVNIVLSAVSLLYLKFLIDQGGLSPYLAGLVIWIARIIDAFTDPGMGRLSDMTRWRSGRRRPYFLIGALPFGFFFALMWLSVPFASEFARFTYYVLVFIGVSLSMALALSLAGTETAKRKKPVGRRRPRDSDRGAGLDSERCVPSHVHGRGREAPLLPRRSDGHGRRDRNR